MLSEENIAAWRLCAPSLRDAEFSDGETLYRQGEEPGFLYCLMRGVVRLSHVAESGAQITLAIAGAGRSLRARVAGTSVGACGKRHWRRARSDVRPF